MVDDLKNAHMGPCQIVKSEENLPQLPSDIYYTIAMGSDIGHLPQNTLMSITGAEENGVPAHKAFMSPGDFCIVAGEGKALPLVLAVHGVCGARWEGVWAAFCLHLLGPWCHVMLLRLHCARPVKLIHTDSKVCKLSPFTFARSNFQTWEKKESARYLRRVDAIK